MPRFVAATDASSNRPGFECDAGFRIAETAKPDAALRVKICCGDTPRPTRPPEWRQPANSARPRNEACRTHCAFVYSRFHNFTAFDQLGDSPFEALKVITVGGKGFWNAILRRERRSSQEAGFRRKYPRKLLSFLAYLDCFRRPSIDVATCLACLRSIMAELFLLMRVK